MQRRYSFRATAVLVMAGLWMAVTSGCATFRPTSVTEMFEKEKPVVTPSSMAVVWTTTQVEGSGEPTRGFGGVVTFYDTKQEKPVRVEGDLTIYAYDELTHQTDTTVPDRKYVFTRQQLEKHYEDGAAGPAYHIWLPWDRLGGPRREVGLIVRFDSAEGKAVMSKPTHTVLPGTTDARDRVWASRVSGVVAPVCHIEKKADAVKGAENTVGNLARKMQVTTVSMPNRMGICRTPNSNAQNPGTVEQSAMPAVNP